MAKAARERNDLPDDLRGPLAADCDDTDPRSPAFPFGSAVCEVEIDPDTGQTEIVRYTAIDDVGRAINPLILHGQTHGGIAQGVGQAMWEHSHYDAVTRAASRRLDDGLRHAAGAHAAVVHDRTVARRWRRAIRSACGAAAKVGPPLRWRWWSTPWSMRYRNTA